MDDQETRKNNLSLAEHLGEFKCHKIVRAAKIMAIEPNAMIEEDKHGQPVGDPSIVGYSIDMEGAGERVAAFVSVEWVGKHQPKAGGYFVVYEDGYASYSPQAAFENGYAPNVRP